MTSYFTIPQSLNGEHLFVGAPAPLYNLTKSTPDPSLLMQKGQEPETN